MKVVHLITRFNAGGTATFLSNLLGQARNDESHLLILGNTSAPEFEDPRLSSLTHIRLRNLRKSSDLVTLVKAFFELRRILIVQAPQILNSHTSHAGVLARLVCKSIPRRYRPIVVHTYHGHLLYGYFSKPKTFLYVMVEKLLSKISDGLIIPGHKMSFELLSSGIITDKIPRLLVNPPVTDYNFNPSFPSVNLSKRLQIGWVGRISQIKRVDRVIELARYCSQFDFHIAGTQQGASIPVFSENVKFHDWVKPEDFWPKMNLAILTSENEAQSLSLLEAARFGVPALATDVGSIRDAVVHGVTGFIAPWDIKRFMEYLFYLNANREFLRELSENAYNRVKAGYQAEDIFQQHQEFFKKLLRLREI